MEFEYVFCYTKDGSTFSISDKLPRGAKIVLQAACRNSNAIKDQAIKICGGAEIKCDPRNIIIAISSLSAESLKSPADEHRDNCRQIIEKAIKTVFPDIKIEDGTYIIINSVVNVFSSQDVDLLINKMPKDATSEFIVNTIIKKYSFNPGSALSKLLLKGTIAINTIYTSQKITSVFNKILKPINMTMFDEFNEKYLATNEIGALMISDVIINDKVFCVTCDDGKWTDFATRAMKISSTQEEFKMCKINGEFYCEEILMSYTPHCVEWDENENYYLVNRSGDCIGGKSNPTFVKKYSGYIFSDTSHPFKSKKNYNAFVTAYNEIIGKLKGKCLNAKNKEVHKLLCEK